MDKLGRVRRNRNGGNVVDEFEGGLNSDAVFIIKVPDSRSLRVISRSLFLAALLLSLPSIGSIIGAASHAPPLHDADVPNWMTNLPILIYDLMEEGLITRGHKGFVLGSGEADLALLRDAGVDLSNRAGSHQVFDYMLAASFGEIEVMGGAIRDGGLAVAPLSGDISAELRLLRNYKIVYLRRLNENTVVAMRKSAASSGAVEQQELCDGGGEFRREKEAALKGLEDVYLEPPRLGKKSSFRFLPDLMKDPLEEYPRRVFIADDSKALDWFYKNYPMRGQEFQVYKMEVAKVEEMMEEMGVRGEDYVVMKAEARVVEQMLRAKILCVVDELFLECGEEEEEEEKGRRERKRKKAYWECVALYGKIRDEGIAVHQWWY